MRAAIASAISLVPPILVAYATRISVIPTLLRWRSRWDRVVGLTWAGTPATELALRSGRSWKVEEEAMMRALVVYASAAGSTAGIAEWITGALMARGHEVV